MGTGEKQNAGSTAYYVYSHQGGSYLRKWTQPFLFFRTTLPLHPVQDQAKARFPRRRTQSGNGRVYRYMQFPVLRCTRL